MLEETTIEPNFFIHPIEDTNGVVLASAVTRYWGGVAVITHQGMN